MLPLIMRLLPYAEQAATGTRLLPYVEQVTTSMGLRQIATNACYCKPLQWWVTPIPTLWKCWTPTAALWQRLPPAPPPPVPGPGTSVGPQWPSPVTYHILSSSNCCLFYLSVCEHVFVCVCVHTCMHVHVTQWFLLLIYSLLFPLPPPLIVYW